MGMVASLVWRCAVKVLPYPTPCLDLFYRHYMGLYGHGGSKLYISFDLIGWVIAVKSYTDAYLGLGGDRHFHSRRGVIAGDVSIFNATVLAKLDKLLKFCVLLAGKALILKIRSCEMSEHTVNFNSLKRCYFSYYVGTL